jgi:integrase
VFDGNGNSLSKKISRFNFGGIRVRSHDFRTTGATNIVKAAGLHVAKGVLGHKSVETTMRYAKITDTDIISSLKKAKSQPSALNDPDEPPKKRQRR